MTFSREDKLVECAKALKVNAGIEPDADLGPVISKQVHTWFKLLPVDVNYFLWQEMVRFTEMAFHNFNHENFYDLSMET